MKKCEKCDDTGLYIYPNTATWASKTGGVSGQMMTKGICDECWGTGDLDRKGINLRNAKSDPQKFLEPIIKAYVEFCTAEHGVMDHSIGLDEKNHVVSGSLMPDGKILAGEYELDATVYLPTKPTIEFVVKLSAILLEQDTT